MKPDRLMTSDCGLVVSWLRHDDYATAGMAKSLRAFASRFPDRPGLLADLALSAMGMGHIELAQGLVDAGVGPGSGGRDACLFGEFLGLGSSVDGQGLTVLHLLAAQRPEAIVPEGQDGGKRRTRKEVLAHVLARPDQWGGDVDAVHAGSTPLIRSQSCDKRAGSLKHLPTGALPGRADLVERDGFQRALIAAGADINHPQARWSFLAASVPMAPPDGGQDPVDMSEIDRALALGADPVAGAPGAWAQAILQDAPNDYRKGQGPGQRAQALVGAGIPLLANPDDPIQSSPIATALMFGAAWALKDLLELGVDTGAWRDPGNGRSILHIAPGLGKASRKLLDMIPECQLQGAVMARGEEGDTPLHEAVAVLDPDLVKRYLGLGADPDARDKRGRTPLESMRASSPKMKARFEEIFGMLDGAGANKDPRPNSILLHNAALMLSTRACQVLIDRGMSVHAKDKAGNTPLDAALFGHQQGAAALFNEQRGRQQVEVVRLMAEHGVDLFSRREGERTLLHEAMGHGNHRVAIELLEAGADPNAEDDMGLTPMHMWGIGEHLRALRIMNPSGNWPEIKGNTVAAMSIKPAHHRHIHELLKAFAAAGADMRSERFEMPAFGSIIQRPGMASVLQAIEFDQATVQVSEPGRPARRM